MNRFAGQHERRVPAWSTLVVLLVASGMAWADSDEEKQRIDKLKAAFAFNFVKFVQWPDEAFEDEDAALVIAVVNDVAIGRALAATVSDRQVHDRDIEIRAVTFPRRKDYEEQEDYDRALARVYASLLRCHAVYFGVAARGDAQRFIESSKAPHLLTIGDGREYISAPTMLDVTLEKGRLVFYANMEQIEKPDLHVSARLLRLARIVEKD
jgi:hypothetical protein